MIHIASLVASEEEARRLAGRLAGDELLGELPIDSHEIAAGRWDVVVYLSGKPDRPTLSALTGIVEDVLGKAAAGFVIEALPKSDWVAKSLEGLKPVRAGRFLVHGRHDRDQRRPNDFSIEIEAGQAFGTGHHGTTAACLMAIDRLARSRPIAGALDLGTGSGVLAIAIAKACKARVLASDIDPVAVRIAVANAKLNGVAGLVRTVAAAGLAGRVFREPGPFELIVANILAGPLVALAPLMCRYLALGGTLILSGLLPEQRARIAAAYRGQGVCPVRDLRLNGWLTLVLERRAARAGRATRRPTRTLRADARKSPASRRRSTGGAHAPRGAFRAR